MRRPIGQLSRRQLSDSRLILCGGSSSGKTTALFNIIDNMDCWDRVTIIVKTLQGRSLGVEDRSAQTDERAR